MVGQSHAVAHLVISAIEENPVTPTKNDFKDMLGSVGQLEERRQQIEKLRNEYFDALKRDDASGQKKVIAEAERQGIELLQNLPLSDLKEFSHLNNVRDKLTEIQSLLQDVNLDELKRTDVSELQRKSQELRLEIGNLSRAVAEASPLAAQARGQTNEFQELTRKMSQAQNELRRQQAGFHSNSTMSRILDLRQHIDSLTFAQFEQQSSILSQQVQNELNRLDQDHGLAVEQRQEMNQHLSEALGQFQWLDKKKQGYPNNDLGLVRRVEQQIRDHRSIEENDLTRLQELWSESNLPVCVIRLLSRARGDQVTSARTLDQESRRWWRDFVGIAEPQASLATKKQRLETLQQKIDAFGAVQLGGNDIEVWLAWRKRVQKAQDLITYLTPVFKDEYGGSPYGDIHYVPTQAGIAPTNLGPGMNRSSPVAAVVRPDLPDLANPTHGVFWRRLWDLLEDSPDEAVFLCAEEWQHVLYVWCDKLPQEYRQLQQSFKKRAADRINRCRVFSQFGQHTGSRN